MNIQQMRYVLAVVDNGSFHAAAKKLYVSQPSLSHGIKALELELNAQLFKRTRQGNFLTPAGTQFVKHARKIVGDVENLQHRFANVHHDHQSFAIASQYCAALSPLLTSLTTSYPDYQSFRLVDGDYQKIIAEVAQFHCQLGILAVADLDLPQLTNTLAQQHLVYETLSTYQTQVFPRPTHPLADKAELRLADLTAYPHVIATPDTHPSSTPTITCSDPLTTVDLIRESDAYATDLGPLTTPASVGLIAKKLTGANTIHVLLIRTANTDIPPIVAAARHELRQYFNHHQQIGA